MTRRTPSIGFHAIASLTALLAPTMAEARLFAQNAPVELPFLRLAVALALCTLCALLLALYLKKNGGRFGALPKFIAGSNWLPKRELAILETHRISAHADACRLSFDGREYLLIVSQGGMHVLHERPAPSTRADA